MKLLEEDMHARLAATYDERADLLYDLLGIRVSRPTIWRMVKRLGYTPRKDQWVPQRETNGSEQLGGLRVARAVDPRRLVFVDEMGTNTSLSPRYAYGPKGRRAYAQVPRNRGAKTTLLASMKLERMGPCLEVEGTTTAKVFEAYIEQVLAPLP